MIDMMQAVQIARVQGRELLSVSNVDIEEIEHDEYSSRKVWAITVSQHRNDPPLPLIGALRPPARRYNRLFIDIESGEVLGMKIREFQSV